MLVSKHGEAWVCGRNRSGQLGLDPASTTSTSVPVHLLPDDNKNNSYSGSSGTGSVGIGETDSIVKTSGGSYTRAQGDESNVVVVEAAAGRAHTLLLLNDGRVLGFGSDEFGAVTGSPAARRSDSAGGGGGGEEEAATAAPHEMRWQPREIEAWPGQLVVSVSAGGEQSFALALEPEGESTTAPAAAVAGAAAITGSEGGY